MAIKKISEFTSGTPTASDKILIEQSGAGKSTTIGNAVNTCSLTYEEIMASTDLSGKVASAGALKTTADKIRIYQFNLPRDISNAPIGDNRIILNSPYGYNNVMYLKFFTYVYGQYRDIDNFFEQISAVDDKTVVGVNLKAQFSTQYNSAVAYAVIYIK